MVTSFGSFFTGRAVKQVPCCRVVRFYAATARQVPRAGFTGHARTGESVRKFIHVKFLINSLSLP